MGYLKDLTGTYEAGLQSLAAMGFVAMVIVLVLRHNPALERAPEPSLPRRVAAPLVTLSLGRGQGSAASHPQMLRDRQPKPVRHVPDLVDRAHLGETRPAGNSAAPADGRPCTC